MATTYEATLVAVAPQPVGPPTFTEVCSLMWTSLVLKDELGGAGSCTLSLQVDKLETVGATRLRDLTQGPCELWVRETTSNTSSTIIFAGPVTGCQIQNRTLTIYAPGLLTYVGYWLRDTDYTATGVDQAVIVKTFVDTWQALPYGNDGITTTLVTATGVVRDMTVSARDGKYILPLIVEMGSRNNGYDLTVDPVTRALRMWSPRKGIDRTGAVFLDRRSIGVPNLAWTVAPGTIGSEVFASASSTLGSTLLATVSNTVLRATFGRSYVSRQYQEVSAQSVLNDYAARTSTDMGTQVFTVSPELIPVQGFARGDFDTGDLITYDFDAGIGRQTFTCRVASIETTLTAGRQILKVGVL